MTTILLVTTELALLAGLGLLTLAAIHTSFVEIPVRQKLSAEGQLQNRKLDFPVASGFLKPFGIGLFLLFIVVAYGSGKWLWALSRLCLRPSSSG